MYYGIKTVTGKNLQFEKWWVKVTLFILGRPPKILIPVEYYMVCAEG
jgi:hypothetical protein